MCFYLSTKVLHIVLQQTDYVSPPHSTYASFDVQLHLQIRAQPDIFWYKTSNDLCCNQLQSSNLSDPMTD